MTLEKLSNTKTLTKPIPIKKILLHSKRPLADDLKRQVIWNYLMKRLKKKRLKGNKFDNRGKELKYLHIAKATGLTYKQVRTLMDRLVKAGLIEKWAIYSNFNCTHNFYRLKD